MEVEVVMGPFPTFSGTIDRYLLDDGRLTYFTAGNPDYMQLFSWEYEGFNNSAPTSKPTSKPKTTKKPKSKNFNYDIITPPNGVSDQNDWSHAGFDYNPDIRVDADKEGRLISSELDNLAGNVSFSTPSKTIWDKRADVLYKINEEDGECTIANSSQNAYLSIVFKNGYRVHVDALGFHRMNQFQYMGLVS